MSIDICICTFMRPGHLELLLQSISKLELPAPVKIYVTDNDASGSARDIVSRYANTTYLIEPRQNISLARNRCINAGTGDFVALIDDDETVDKQWLASLYSHLNSSGHDVAFGKVVSIMPNNPPRWLQYSRTFLTKEGKFDYTTNCMFRRSLLRQLNLEFDPEMGLTGGEDTKFFRQIRASGGQLSYCEDAISWEDFRGRANNKWAMQRRIRIGGTAQRINKSPRLLFLAMIIISGFVVLSPILPILYFALPVLFANLFDKFLFAVGVMGWSMFGFNIEEYRNPVPR